MLKKSLLFTLIFSCCGSLLLEAQQSFDLVLNTKSKRIPIQPTMYGLFFEDINMAADGGLYAELVKNRSFDFPQQLLGWFTFGNVTLLKENAPFKNNPTYVKLSPPSHSHKRTGIENEGFRGMGFKRDSMYRFSVWAQNDGNAAQKLKINFIDANGGIIGNQELIIDSKNWKKYQVVIKANATDNKGRLRIFLASTGTVYLDHVSLFPVDTWQNRENGLRQDIAQALYDLKPGVFRFPGGCIVEGTDIEDRYDWKKSVGPIENRPLNSNRWHYTFEHRFYPDYYQTYGLGFYEFFLLSEDIGAEPLPVVNVGMACQYQNDSAHCSVAMNELEPFIQDALDLIEFANGDITTKWGNVRAKMGHPAPFNLKLLGVGNEQWGLQYVQRLSAFERALRAKHPEIKIIGSSGPSAEGDKFNYLWPEMKKLKVDLVDEHYYKDPKWFLNNAGRYDNYDKKGPAVFAGEYACHVPGRANNFMSALYEGAFMTGLERNADIVHMCTYAPLLAHVEGWQWRPDMIWFDNLRIMKTPNYYVQQFYAKNKGTHTASLLANNKSLTGQEGLFASAVYDAADKTYILKVANTSEISKVLQVKLEGLNKKALVTVGECAILQSDNLETVNTLDAPNVLVPKKVNAVYDKGILTLPVDKLSFGVYRLNIAD